jgi:hypothetical protein
MAVIAAPPSTPLLPYPICRRRRKKSVDQPTAGDNPRWFADDQCTGDGNRVIQA